MYYFNRILRPSYYKTNIKHKCIDHCHDCVAMINLLKEYSKILNQNKLIVSKMSKEMIIQNFKNENFITSNEASVLFDEISPFPFK